ncbi:MAG: tail fiber domain-containing protein [Bacteroidales bacterium]|jgi:hypothetical protein
MKKIILLGLIMGFALSNIHAQMQMSSSNGNLSIAASPSPNAWTKLGVTFSSTSSSSSSRNYTLVAGNTPTSSMLYYYGVYGVTTYSTPESYSQTYGVFGEAANASNGYNYGVFGQLAGSHNGAGIYGADYNSGQSNTGGNYAGYFAGNVYSTANMYATNFIPTSDKRFKKNITPLTNTVSNKITQLKAVTYKFKTRQELRADGTIPTDTSRSDTVNGKFINYTHFGFIAQDVQNVFPNLVYQKDDGFLGLNYTEMIPLIIVALKQQDSIINQQNATITALQQQVNNCCTTGHLQKTDDKTGINNTSNSDATPVLYQNNPNPFSQQTQIKCFIPENSMVSAIYIYDMQGTQIKKIPINGKNSQNIVIQGSELKAGMYMYSLIIDGKVIDTKKMVLTD